MALRVLQSLKCCYHVFIFTHSFEVGIANGTISASRVLDYEQNAEYEFFVLAYDEGRFMAEDKDNVASFRVSLVDINDNNPMFEGTPYNVEIMENQTNVVFVLQASSLNALRSKANFVIFVIYLFYR